MKVALIQPRSPSLVLDYRYRGEHLGLCSLEAVLSGQGHQVVQFDDALALRDASQTIPLVKPLDPDLIGVAVPAQQVAGQTLHYVAELRHVFPRAFICTGGIYATYAHRDLLAREPGLDAVVRGEGEHTLSELAAALEQGRDLGEIRGLTFRRGDELVETPDRGLEPDVSLFPPPSRSTLPYLLRENRRVGLYSARGCYGSCTFCSLHAFWGSQCVRVRTPEQTVAEIDTLVAAGVRKLRFINDIFIDQSRAGQEWLAEFYGLLAPRQYDLNLWMQFRAQDVYPEMLSRLRDLGLSKMLIGLESGSQASLDHFHKQTTVAENERAVQVAVEAGIGEVAIGFIMFHPYATLDDMRHNLAFLSRMPTFRYKNLFSSVCLYAGTPLRDRVHSDGLLEPGPEWYDVEGYRFKSPEVQALHDQADRLKSRYGEMIWLESAVDVEERIIKGALCDRGLASRSLDGRPAAFFKSFGRFKEALSAVLLREFIAIVDAACSGDLRGAQGAASVEGQLAAAGKALDRELAALQRMLDLPQGYRLGQEAVSDLLT